MILIFFRSLGLINLYFTEYILSVIIKYQKLFLRHFTLCVITFWISLKYPHQPEIPKSYSLWGVAWLLLFQRLLYHVTYNFSCSRDDYFSHFGQNDVPLWIEIFQWCENLSYHLSEQYQGIKFYIFILIFLSKCIHLLSVVFTTYENSQTVKIVNPLLYEYAAVNTIAFQLLLLCKEPLNLNHKPFKEPQFLIVNCRLQSFNLQET